MEDARYSGSSGTVSSEYEGAKNTRRQRDHICVSSSAHLICPSSSLSGSLSPSSAWVLARTSRAANKYEVSLDYYHGNELTQYAHNILPHTNIFQYLLITHSQGLFLLHVDPTRHYIYCIDDLAQFPNASTWQYLDDFASQPSREVIDSEWEDLLEGNQVEDEGAECKGEKDHICVRVELHLLEHLEHLTVRIFLRFVQSIESVSHSALADILKSGSRDPFHDIDITFCFADLICENFAKLLDMVSHSSPETLWHTHPMRNRVEDR
jgi:hypothetical protein